MGQYVRVSFDHQPPRQAWPDKILKDGAAQLHFQLCQGKQPVAPVFPA
jgi:hypothetical protein